MKVNVLLFLLGMFVFFTACKDEEEEPCVPGTLAETVIGSWSSSFEPGEAEFLADGTLIDPNGILIAVEINDVVYDQKSYEVLGDTAILLIAAPASGEGSSESEIEVTGYECDVINMSVFGLPFNLTRN